MRNMKKTFLYLPLAGAVFAVTLTCSQVPLLSDLYNNRITLVLKGTYESNTPYGWNTSVYTDDSLASYTGAIATSTPLQSNVSLYLDIADIRLSTGTGKPANVAPQDYWTYFTPKREVFCSNNYANGNLSYKILSCYNDNGDQNYLDLFSSGFTFPAVDVPQTTYKHMAIFFRKVIAGPAIAYSDAASNGPTTQTTTFDNRFLDGINLMDSIVQYDLSDTTKATPLLFPLQRTDLLLEIPPGRDPYVMEVRIFLKNLLMKHVIQHNGGVSTAGPLTFVGPSDWKLNHASTDLTGAYQMGGNIAFTARIYDPANVGNLKIVDNWNTAAYSSGAYYAVLPTGTIYNTNTLPYAATSVGAGGGTITNLPPGSYDIYRTCDKKQWQSGGFVAVDGKDGYPETVVKCDTKVVTAGSTTNSADLSLVGACTAACP